MTQKKAFIQEGSKFPNMLYWISVGEISLLALFRSIFKGEFNTFLQKTTRKIGKQAMSE